MCSSFSANPAVLRSDYTPSPTHHATPAFRNEQSQVATGAGTTAQPASLHGGIGWSRWQDAGRPSDLAAEVWEDLPRLCTMDYPDIEKSVSM